ncbi:hypothetical protein [Mesorhizobium sp. M2C.T.Ca.TU.002.02.1.1]|uniref:hypothetical protein n=1 Tax=Mesorhizobium sp. M2C.T.Ca.TU.002.02.1.1 TaxID=2496788 RepID=UPI000FCAAEEA|nr:hypothetical protein [Mesorhizobium sp. M2C.T.Ca.TU.002.02.1.1]RUU57046.1 hypothetical protein EOD07_14060 [Mesorhizobium sp. M2C.T.Ca.TU.002.02.1.1]RUU64222.1 hypothetical protein EOD04_21380 [Mesorhizobium sp. M2C.T.Ca.TU.009.01.2.1]
MSDSAQRLLDLIAKMKTASHAFQVENSRADKAPLWKSFDPLAKQMGLKNYADLRDHFLALCANLREQVSLVDLKRESVRQSWLATIDEVSSVFDASNAALVTNAAFSSCFADVNLGRIEAISERLETEGAVEAPKEKLEEAFAAIREAVEELESSGKIQPQFSRLFNHYLQQMEISLKQHDDFGENMFWSLYKHTFATFVQLHPVISGLDNNKAIWEKVWAAASKMHYGLTGLSLAANVVTLAPAVTALLGN